jgi:hypothetical protein
MNTRWISKKTRRGTVWVMSLAVAVLFPSATEALEDASPVRVIGAVRLHDPSAPRAQLVEWALARYRAAHLEVPSLDLYFHPDPSGCRGNLGRAANGRVDLCVRLAMEPGPQRIVLHELAHAWAEVHLDEASRAAFNRFRGVATWNNAGAEWKDRGNEQAAEIMAWGLGDGTMGPMISGDRESPALAAAFQMLTGAGPLHHAA